MENSWILLALALTQAAPAMAQSDSGCAMLAAGKSSQAELDRYYGSRAVEIVRLARAGDKTALTVLVSPDFDYRISDADYIYAPRKEQGVKAALAIAGILSARSYRISSPFNMLTVSGAPLTCTWRVTVVFEGAGNRDAISADFSFVDDKLARVDGQTLVETREAIR